MARVYSRRKGKSGSKKPMEKKAEWVTYKPAEIEDIIVKLAKSGMGSARIGLVLRDQYGIPSVKIKELHMSERIAKTMKKHNVKPEVEAYGTNGIANAGFLIRAGQLSLPMHIQYVLGVLGGSMATPYELMHLQTETQRFLGAGNFTWSVIGVGYPAEFHLGAVAMAMGGHVRVGMEDNIYIKRNVLTKSNAELVEKIVKIAELFEREIATPDDARQILGLKGGDKVKF